MLFMCGDGHSERLSVSFHIPWVCPGVLPLLPIPFPETSNLFFFPRCSVTWLGGARLSSLPFDFARKTSTSSKFSFLFPAFPFRPFVFPLSIICSCKSGRLSRVIPILFPCPVNQLSRPEWPAFPACFSNFARFSRAIFVFFFFARHFSYSNNVKI